MCLVFFCPSGNILPGNLPGTSGGNIAAHRGRQKSRQHNADGNIAARNADDKSRQRNAGGKKSTAQCGRQKSRQHNADGKSRQRNAGGKKVDSTTRTKCSPLTPPNFAFSQPTAFLLFAARHIFLHNFRCYRRRGDLLKMPGSGRTISRKNGDGNNFQGDGNYYHLPLNSCFSFVYFRETGFSRISERTEANPAKKQKCPIFIILHDHNFFWR